MCILNNNTDSTNNEIKESTGITVVILELIPGEGRWMGDGV